MASTLLSRLFGTGSVYEALREGSDDIEASDNEDRPKVRTSVGDPTRSLPLMPIVNGLRGENDDDDVPQSMMVEDIQKRSDHSFEPSNLHSPAPDILNARHYRTSSKDLALWRWANIQNLDRFLQDVTIILRMS